MRIVLRSLRLLSLVVWLGGVVFFAFVVAPVAFSPAVTVPAGGMRISGYIVGETLRALHWMGLACGVVFAGCVLGLRRRLAMAELCIVGAMMLLTAISQFGVIPRMDQDRVRAGGDIDAAADTNPAKVDFERLHHISEQMEGFVLVGGLALVGLLGCESSTRHHHTNTID